MTIEATLEMLVRGVHSDIEDRFRDNQVARCNIYETWDGQDEDPDITVSMRTDCRYALCKFRFNKKKLLLHCEIIFYTKYYVPEEERVVDLVDPKGLTGLADWMIAEITDGLKRGWSDRQEKRIA